MKKPIHILLVLLIMLGMLAAAPISALAACMENTGPNPDVWTCNDADADGMTTNEATDTVVVGSAGNVTNAVADGTTIETMDGAVTNGGSVSNNETSGAAIFASGTAAVTNSGSVGATGDAGTGISTSDGDVVNDGSITANGDFGTGVATLNGDVTNNGIISANGTVAGTGISTGGGADTVTLGAGSSTSGTTAAVSTGAGSDTVTVNQGASVTGLIDGGMGTDTLTFTFLTQAQLAGLDPALGFYGSYSWANFELLIGQLIQAAQNGHKRVYFRNKEIHARGIGSSRLTGINIYAEPGKIAFVPFSALPLIPFGGGVRFQLLNPENWFAVVVNHGPYENNVEHNLYQVFIYDGNGGLVSNEQSFVH